MSDVSEGYHIWIVGGAKKYVHLKWNGTMQPDRRGITNETKTYTCKQCPWEHEVGAKCDAYEYYIVTEYTRDEFLALSRRVTIDPEEYTALNILNSI